MAIEVNLDIGGLYLWAKSFSLIGKELEDDLSSNHDYVCKLSTFWQRVDAFHATLDHNQIILGSLLSVRVGELESCDGEGCE